MQPANDAFEAWKDAELLARAVETRLQHCWEAYLRGEGPPPAATLMADVSRVRNQANDKLTVAMLLMSVAVKRAG